MRKTRIILSILVVLIFAIHVPLTVKAFNTVAAWKLDDPDNVKIYISTTLGTYRDKIATYTNTWETYCPEIGITNGSSADCNIYFYGDLSVYTGSYATTNSTSNNEKTITFYSSFVDATESQRNETIVHEVGHALGLAHCDAKDNSISVMRATGFNGVARPLSDDIDGIAYLYIQ